MGKKVGLVVAGLALAGAISGCSSTYGIQPGGPHFASWTHAAYSLRAGEKPALKKAEMDEAEKDAWWGIPIRYSIDELE